VRRVGSLSGLSIECFRLSLLLDYIGLQAAIPGRRSVSEWRNETLLLVMCCGKLSWAMLQLFGTEVEPSVRFR
jgi:hypothetical protein